MASKKDYRFEMLITFFESMGQSEDCYNFLLGSEKNFTHGPDILFKLNSLPQTVLCFFHSCRIDIFF